MIDIYLQVAVPHFGKMEKYFFIIKINKSEVMSLNLRDFLSEKINEIRYGEEARKMDDMDKEELCEKRPDFYISIKELKQKMSEGVTIFGFTPQIDNPNQESFILTHSTLHLNIQVLFNSCYSRPVFNISIDSTGCSRLWYLSKTRSLRVFPWFMYLMAYEVENIEKSFWEYKPKYEEEMKIKEKEEKIKEISKNSIETWLTATLKDKGYTYYISKGENKIILSVRMKNGTQLDIPVYYKRFRKIMPVIIETIEKYEQLIDNTSVKVLMSNLKANAIWNK